MKKFWQQDWFWLVLAVILFLVTRLVSLTLLPVFTDEAIYIRWSQLIIDDPGQYLFFPMNDGKTPLQMWLMIPFLLVFKDPLWAGRFLSVGAGLAQMIIVYLIIGELGKIEGREQSKSTDKKQLAIKLAQRISLFLSIFIPIWFFHQRMALTDGLLVLFFSLAIWATLKMLQSKNFWPWLLLASLMIGLAFWTKIPAILCLPTIFCLIFLQKKPLNWKNYKTLLGKILAVCGGGVLIFGLLALAPAFSQLFARGGDFLMGGEEIRQLGLGELGIIFGGNLGSVGKIITSYFGWGLILVPVLSLILRDKKEKNWQTYAVFLVGTLGYILPIAVLGKVVYPRYYLPAFLPLTIMASLAIGDLVVLSKSGQEKAIRYWARTALVIFGIDLILISGRFLWPAWTAPENINFVAIDRYQYLDEWSAGYGIKETVAKIQTEAEQKKILVLTEGNFGTLPDALNMYLFKKDLENIKTEGIGYPVEKIPETIEAQMAEYDETWLVVNSNRLGFEIEPEKLLVEYPRPNPETAKLQIWQIN